MIVKKKFDWCSFASKSDATYFGRDENACRVVDLSFTDWVGDF